MVERARKSRTTLAKVEKGDPSVSVGMYATVLFILGLEDGLADLADARQDVTGLRVAGEPLPQRIRTPRRQDEDPKDETR